MALGLVPNEEQLRRSRAIGDATLVECTADGVGVPIPELVGPLAQGLYEVVTQYTIRVKQGDAAVEVTPTTGRVVLPESPPMRLWVSGEADEYLSAITGSGVGCSFEIVPLSE